MMIKKTILNQIHIFFALLLVHFLISCGNTPEKESGHLPTLFTVKTDLKAKTLIKGPQLQDPWDIALIDSTLIIGNYKGEPLLELYDLFGKPIKQTTAKGKGPGEILVIGNIQVSQNNNNFWVYDLFGKKLLKFSLKELLKKEKYVPETLVTFSNEKESSAYFSSTLVGNDYLIGESISPQGRFALLKPNGSLIKYMVNFPEKTDKSLSAIENAKLYEGELVLSPDRKKLAFVTNNACRIDLYEVTQTGIDSIWSYERFPPNGYKRIQIGGQSQIAFTNKAQTGYLDIATSENFVYALFSGKKIGEKDYSFGNIIHVVSWDGRKTFEYHLDKNINRLTVDADKVIYGTSINEYGEPEIVKFENL
ncbi:BF3164 family lipoprotein [Rapidithrix thailandica]|uniref:BF3164 family lipoprotein n=1 Tax=Rapidithrix thailandica TaxID=413964 RepID=A0AAW9SGK6_9BACT